MDSINTVALNDPSLDDSLHANESPVLLQKPIFFAFDSPHASGSHEISEWGLDYMDCEPNDEFRKKVNERKLKGFVGNEYTVKEAMSKQFGPEQIEARAFLEYYWEMKANCLEAVEKNRNSDVETFQRHPLFSPDWLVPNRRDIRWYLKNEAGNKENHVINEMESNETKSENLVKQRKMIVKNASSIACRQFSTSKDVRITKNKPNERKQGIPLTEVRKKIVQNASSIACKPFTASKDVKRTKDKPNERKQGIPLKEVRKPWDKSLPVVTCKKFPSNGDIKG